MKLIYFLKLMILWPFVKGFWWSDEQLTEGATGGYASRLAVEQQWPGLLNNGLFQHEINDARMAAVIDIILIGATIMIPMGIAIIRNLLIIS